MFSAAPSFSCVGSRVTLTGQMPSRSSEPSASESLWIRPFGEAAYTYRPSGSISGLAVVICALPAQPAYPGGVNVHRIWPLWASIASVLPYVVVTTIVSCTAPCTWAVCR